MAKITLKKGEQPAGTIMATVTDRLVHDGEVYGPGDQIELPMADADALVTSGVVEIALPVAPIEPTPAA